jgi:chromosome partitioning protein
MILTVASYKGGVGKTTTAVHLAAYLQTLAPTLLLDGDQTRNATAWSQRASSDAVPGQRGAFPFRVAPIDQAAKLARDYEHIVIDTGQRPSPEDLQAAAEGCDLMVVPAVPSALDTDGLGQTVRALQKIQGANFSILLTRVAPDAGKERRELRDMLDEMNLQIFESEIPRLKAFEKAAAFGTTVEHVDDRNAARAWEAYLAVGRQVLR